LFNWIFEKTDIQGVSKVRSHRGLLVHVIGRIVTAFSFLIFNSQFSLFDPHTSSKG